MFETSWTSFCVTFITGSPGAGKSFCLVRDIYARLAEHRGPIVTNLPINIENFSKAAAKKYKRTEAEIKEQIVFVPRNVLQTWKEGAGTPGDLAKQPQLVGLEKIKGALFILDECHLFCPSRSRPRQAAWESWLGEVRHEGWRGVYFVSQDQSKVGPAIKDHAELRYELTKADKLRDPIFGIELGLWWELVASFTGDYKPSISIAKYRRKMGKLVPEDTQRVLLDADYFPLYESFQAAGGGTVEEAVEVPLLEYQKRPKLWSIEGNGEEKIRPVWQWFFFRTWHRVLPRIALACLVYWMSLGGGGTWVMETYMASFQGGLDHPASVYIDPKNPGLEPVPVEPTAISFGEMEEQQIEQQEIEVELSGEVLSVSNAATFAKIVANLPEDQKTIIVDQLKKIEENYQNERTKVFEAEQKRQAKEDRKRLTLHIVAVIGKRAWLSDGTDVVEGETIMGGELDGLECQRIVGARRKVYFSDGLVLSMGKPNGLRTDEQPNGQPDKKPETSPSEAGSATIREPVPKRSTNPKPKETNNDHAGHDH